MASPNANRAPISPLLCPLAVDEAGNPLAVPPEASYWRVRRDTGGRPRIVNGADLKPLKLPLEFPPEEALNLLGRGSFRFDLCDEAGQQLETVTLKLGQPEPELRNRAGVEDAEPATPATMLPAIGSDVRLVLEANVRATQLAFQHNERTLAASLRLAETLREGVHVLAESQADWIKSLATSRSFFRNAPRMMALPPGVSDADDDEEPDEADEDTDVEQEQPPSLVELLKPGVVRLADRLADGATAWAMARGAGAAAVRPAPNTERADAGARTEGEPSDAELASRGFEARELYDLNYSCRKGAAKRAAKQAASSVAAARDPQMRSAADLQARIMKDPALAQHLVQVNAQLRPEETARILELVTNSPISRQEEFLTSIKAVSVEQAVLGVRNLIEHAAESSPATSATTQTT